MAICANTEAESYSLCWLVINNVRHSMGLPLHKFDRVLTEENKYHREIVKLLEADDVR